MDEEYTRCHVFSEGGKVTQRSVSDHSEEEKRKQKPVNTRLLGAFLMRRSDLAVECMEEVNSASYP
jgi:hypothetical protein